MTLNSSKLKAVLEARKGETIALLSDLIAIPSTRGNEGQAMRYLKEKMASVVDESKLIPISDDIQKDPDYSFPLENFTYKDQPNLRLFKRGAGGGKSLIINTHLDVVPPSPDQESPFHARIKDGLLYGRGACDCKGQVATLYLALAALKDLGVKLKGDLIGHLVIEEECGGNGTLAAIRGKDRADAAIVLEPSEFKILPSIRGAVWFVTTCYGRAGHSGQAGRTVSALKEAIKAVGILEAYHADLLKASKGHPLYDRFENPMPITFGQMQAGDWPAMAPRQATFKGVLGILPNKTKEQVMAEMRAALKKHGGEWLANNFDMDFIYRHDSNEVPVDHPLVKTLESACKQSGRAPEVTAMPASCDAWFYTNLIGVPAVVIGSGSLSVAHSALEHIPVDDIVHGAEILSRAIAEWCG